MPKKKAKSKSRRRAAKMLTYGGSYPIRGKMGSSGTPYFINFPRPEAPPAQIPPSKLEELVSQFQEYNKLLAEGAKGTGLLRQIVSNTVGNAVQGGAYAAGLSLLSYINPEAAQNIKETNASTKAASEEGIKIEEDIAKERVRSGKFAKVVEALKRRAAEEQKKKEAAEQAAHEAKKETADQSNRRFMEEQYDIEKKQGQSTVMKMVGPIEGTINGFAFFGEKVKNTTNEIGNEIKDTAYHHLTKDPKLTKTVLDPTYEMIRNGTAKTLKSKKTWQEVEFESEKLKVNMRQPPPSTPHLNTLTNTIIGVTTVLGGASVVNRYNPGLPRWV